MTDDRVEAPELRQGAEWRGRDDAELMRLEVLGRTHDGLMLVQRVAGAPGYMLRKPFPVSAAQLRAAYVPVPAPGETTEYDRTNRLLGLLAERLGLGADELDRLPEGVGAFDRGAHFGVFLPLDVLDRLLKAGER